MEERCSELALQASPQADGARTHKVTQHWTFAQNRYTLINNPKVLYEDEDIFMCADMLLSNEWTMAQFHRGLLSFLFASLEG